MIARTLALALLSLTLMTPALAGKRPQAEVVDDALAYAETDRAKAIRLLSDALKEDKLDEDERHWIELNLAEQQRLSGMDAQAKAHFTAVSKASRSKLDEAAALGLALLDGAPAAKLPDPDERYTPETLSADRHLALARAAATAGDADAVRDHTRRALTFAKADPAVEARVRAALIAIKGVTPKDPTTPDTTPVDAPLPLMAQARAAFEEGRSEEARSLALAAKAASPDDVQRADALLEMLDAGTRVQPKLIGVLLPLEGKYGAAAAQVQSALEFGFHGGPQDVRLVFRDSGATPETAAAAFQQLAVKDGVIGVIGPLLTPETDAVVDAAERYGVPLLSLSQALVDSPDRDWTVQAMVSADHQVNALVNFAVDTKGFKSYAIFAPDNNYGHRSAESFRAAVESKGGAITVEAFYDATATDLIPFAKELGRKDYEARAYEFRELKKAIEERGGNPDRAVLPPTIDFEALFIPDSATRVSLACAALAYEEFPLGDFQPTKDGPTIPLLGLSGWHNPEIVSRGGEYTRGGFFTDSFAELDTDAIRFADSFREQVGHSPSALEAISADTTTLLAAALTSRPNTRSQLRQALNEAKVPATATGILRVDPETGVASRQLRILSINREAIFQVFPDPNPQPVCEDGASDCAPSTAP